MQKNTRLGLGSAAALALLTLFTLAPEEGVAEVTVERKVPDKPLYEVTFRSQPVIAVSSVHLAGTFNGWNKTATPMLEKDGTGVYEAHLQLPPGRHEYKFVLNNKTWVRDEGNELIQPDGQGGYNSVVHVGPPAPEGKGVRGDGEVSLAAILHDPTDLTFASLIDNTTRLILRIHVRADDVERVEVELGERREPARRLATLANRDVYEARIHFPEGAPERIRYRFLLHDGAEPQPFGHDSQTTKDTGEEGAPVSPPTHEPFELERARAARFQTPDWVRDAIFYQIFPDRFDNADPSNDAKGLRPLEPRPEGRRYSKNDAYIEAWGAKPSYFNVFGGDLKGIERRLDHLEALGVNAIYLNPIFAAWSNHRYDAADYTRVDPRLGTMADFESLCKAAKARGIRIILDCVFNHTGHKHGAFQDIIRHGKRSKYWNWYFIKDWPITRKPKPSYECWWDFPDLPQLNTANEEVVQHLLEVATLWLDKGAAGWRLDVPNEVEAVNPQFWTRFRERVRKTHPDAYIVGEIWTDAAPWLNESKFDATMNYPLRRAVLDYVIQGDGDAERFARVLAEQRARLPAASANVQFNLLGSHDTARIKHVAKGDEARVQLAYGLVLTYLGPPVIYYGDELGMTGDKDPDCRRCMPWDTSTWSARSLERMKALIALRNSEPALRRGLVEDLATSGAMLAFTRRPEAGQPGRPLWVVANASSAPGTLTISGHGLPEADLTDLLGGAKLSAKDGGWTVTLPPQGLAVLAHKP